MIYWLSLDGEAEIATSDEYDLQVGYDLENEFILIAMTCHLSLPRSTLRRVLIGRGNLMFCSLEFHHHNPGIFARAFPNFA